MPEEFNPGGASTLSEAVRIHYESNDDRNALTNALLDKLNNIEAGATADQTGAEIVVAINGEADANLLSDAQVAALSNIRTVEELQDLVAAMLQGGNHSNVSVVYNDAAGTIDLTSTAGGGGGTLTQEQVEDFVANVTVSGTGINVDYDDPANTLTISLTGEVFTTANRNKLNGIAAGAQVNHTAAEIRDLLATLVNGIRVDSIELGHDSDTTITRTGPGRIAVEGNEILTDGSGEVLADGTIAAADKMVFFDTDDNGDPKLTAPNALVALLSLVTTDGVQTLTNKTLIYGLNAQTGTAYTLALTDAHKKVTMDSAAANALTIPSHATVPYPVGTIIGISTIGAGATTVQAAAGVAVNGVSGGGAEILEQFTGVTLTNLATDSWLMEGNHGAVA